MVPIPVRAAANPPTDEYPLVLNTGRIRDQWHTMTRTARAARLNAHIAEPFVQVHPVDAASAGLNQGALALLTSPWGRMLARGVVRRARADALVNPATDPISGQPELKHTPVRIEAFEAAWHGFLLSRTPLGLDAPDYCVEVKADGFLRYELAGTDTVSDWQSRAHDLLGVDGEWLDFADPAAGRYRGARLEHGRLTACLFVAQDHELPARAWLGGLFAPDRLDGYARTSLLAGRPARGQKDAGEAVCACFNVRLTVSSMPFAPRGSSRWMPSAARCRPEPTAAPACRSWLGFSSGSRGG